MIFNVSVARVRIPDAGCLSRDSIQNQGNLRDRFRKKNRPWTNRMIYTYYPLQVALAGLSDKLVIT